jgi:hypothetical protein
VASLLGLASTAEPSGDVSPVEAKAALLRRRLGDGLPPDTTVVESLPRILGEPYRALLPMSGRPLGQVLLDKDTPLEVLERVKRHARQRAARKDLQTEHDVLIAIYFSAIASALLFADRKITRYSYAQLAESFEALAVMPWIPAELASHFSAARDRCRGRNG